MVQGSTDVILRPFLCQRFLGSRKAAAEVDYLLLLVEKWRRVTLFQGVRMSIITIA